MGTPRRASLSRVEEHDVIGGRKSHARPTDSIIAKNLLEAGTRSRFPRKHPLPGVGDRIGELTVMGCEKRPTGGLGHIIVQCSCGRPPHKVLLSNWVRGTTTRCNRCAHKATGVTKSGLWGYADIVADPSHRRRLLNRISACLQRCHNPKDAAFKHYGGRGIFVFEPWRKDHRAFLAHLVTLDGWDDPYLDLDREHTDRGYEPGNLRFVTRSVNCRNKRKMSDLQDRITELEACLRSCKCGASSSLHNSH